LGGGLVPLSLSSYAYAHIARKRWLASLGKFGLTTAGAVSWYAQKMIIFFLDRVQVPNIIIRNYLIGKLFLRTMSDLSKSDLFNCS